MRHAAEESTFLSPTSLEDALRFLNTNPKARPFAGGTDLMVLLGSGKAEGGTWVNLLGVPGLSEIRALGDRVEIGALATYTQIRANDAIRSEFPMLGEAASETGGLAIQNRGTLGGNIANASPAADSPPALLAYEASLVLASSSGERSVPYDTFHKGYKKTELAPGELIVQIVLPRKEGPRFSYYRKVGPRKAQAISKTCVAISVAVHGVRIALGGVGPTVVRARRTEDRAVEFLRGRGPISAVSAALDSEISPIDDIRSTERYRRRVTHNLVFEGLLRAKSAGFIP